VPYWNWYQVRVLARCADGPRRFGRDLTFATTPPPPPTSKEQCKHGGWKNYPQFKNQGDCVAFVATAGKNEPSQASPQRLARSGRGVVAPD
jgi:hypothetical protein